MTGIIVLCRYNSSRLPGKILMKLKGKELLGYIMERLAVLGGKYPVVVCTSSEKSDDPIVAYCKEKQLHYYRGDLDNVAHRFLNCAKQFGFENAVRINGDNLFLDAHLIDTMIGKHENNKRLFVSNVKDRTFPRGMSIEIVKTDFYESMYPHFNESDKEHVMTYFYRLDNKNIEYVYNKKVVDSALNLAIDTPEDLNKANKILEAMNRDHTLYGYKEIINLVDSKKHDT